MDCNPPHFNALLFGLVPVKLEYIKMNSSRIDFTNMVIVFLSHFVDLVVEFKEETVRWLKFDPVIIFGIKILPLLLQVQYRLHSLPELLDHIVLVHGNARSRRTEFIGAVTILAGSKAEAQAGSLKCEIGPHLHRRFIHRIGDVVDFLNEVLIERDGAWLVVVSELRVGQVVEEKGLEHQD